MKRVQICEYALIIITLLVSLASSNSISSALITSSATIPSTGTIQIITAKNYAHVPDNWDIGATWSAPWYLDTSVLHNGHVSIRSERSGTKSREILCVDRSWAGLLIRVKPGDHIVFSVWMKLNPSTVGCNHISAGMRLGIDFKHDPDRITGVQSLDGAYWTPSGGFPSNQYLSYVNWGQNWTQRVMDFIIPAQYPADGYGDVPAGTMMTPDSMVPWIQVWCDSGHAQTDDGLAWFADAELYINP